MRAQRNKWKRIQLPLIENWNGQHGIWHCAEQNALKPCMVDVDMIMCLRVCLFIYVSHVWLGLREEIDLRTVSNAGRLAAMFCWMQPIDSFPSFNEIKFNTSSRQHPGPVHTAPMAYNFIFPLTMCVARKHFGIIFSWFTACNNSRTINFALNKSVQLMRDARATDFTVTNTFYGQRKKALSKSNHIFGAILLSHAYF